MKRSQGRMPVAGFANDDPFGALLHGCLESGPCRRTVIDYKDSDQANSFLRRATTLVASRAAGVAIITRFFPGAEEHGQPNRCRNFSFSGDGG
jgi:hypothetical protein